MKVKNQIKLIKSGYIITLSGVCLLSLKDAIRGFNDGWSSNSNQSSLGFLQGSLVLLITILGMGVVSKLYRFIDSVEKDEVFSEANLKLLKRMGLYCTVIPFLLFSFNTTVYMQNFKGESGLLLSIIENVDFQIWLLIFGLTLFTIACVFKMGIALKAEQDLTI
ncbi:DUF2975 domain-containing protein [Pedobacter sandarakinus]|uniref:DUF2975 domain-containing protein n=1 Tax=Pedobacter sandarakinus TaxID=353156 RepID=UPI002245DF17|nr:DUF2975 domain-containing protein [Pedobacter sandarakinus]MCX2574820.1 DUF2975 domain-containing protein [Pedobacter sandarakinus]